MRFFFLHLKKCVNEAQMRRESLDGIRQNNVGKVQKRQKIKQQHVFVGSEKQNVILRHPPHFNPILS